MINDLQYQRYQRQIILKEFGEAGQQKLLNASVLVIGAGGLGCPALQYLAAAGIGRLGIMDDDIVMLSNLHRQILYTTEDIGLPKAVQAYKRLREVNSDIQIIPYNQRLVTQNALTILNSYDYVLDGTDNFETRYLINDACYILGKPLVYGAVSKFEGQVAVFNVQDKEGIQTNYRDLFPNPPIDGDILNCAEAGVLGVLPGIIGTMQANETIKLIAGLGTPLINKLLTYNALSNQVYEVMISVNNEKVGMPNNEAEFLDTNYNWTCVTDAAVEIDVDRFNLLRQLNDVMLIDVREPDELPKVTHLNHLKMPLQTINLASVSIEDDVVVTFCQSGKRSHKAALLMREHFGKLKKIYSLKGGVEALMQHHYKP